MKVYKGFTKDMKCRDFQYKEGGEYEQEGEIKICENGFHACEYPLDCFAYYTPNDSVFHECELSGDICKADNDTKVSGSKIKIGARLDIAGLVNASFEYIKKRAVKSTANHSKAKRKINSATGAGSANSATGNRSANSATGDWSANSATGDWSANSATGDWSANSATGNRSANSATGDWSANSATGDWSANSATGYGSANSATGDWSANSATGDWSANSATGDWSANSATGAGSANSATGNRSANSATGDWSANSATGYGSANISTGTYCKNDAAGEANISVGWGKENKCKGRIGSYLVVSEWGDWDGEKYSFIGAQMVVVDGKKIKADTWYMLKNGKVVEVEQ